MEKKKNNTKQIAVAALAVIIIAALALVFLLPAPSFEQEYARLSLAWKDNGLDAEHLHASEEAFSLEASKLNSIKNGIISFKAGTGNTAAGELADVFLAHINFSIEYSGIEKFRASIDTEKPFCENKAKLEELGAKMASLKEKRNAYLNAANAFVEKFPEEAEAVSLSGVEAPGEDRELEGFLAAIELLGGDC